MILGQELSVVSGLGFGINGLGSRLIKGRAFRTDGALSRNSGSGFWI